MSVSAGSAGDVRVVRNTHAAARGEAYGGDRGKVLSPQGFDAALAEIRQWPDYRPTPLHRLPGLARTLGLTDVLYKDEALRFGLKSFKALGGAYAVARAVAAELGRQGRPRPAAADVMAGRCAEAARGLTITSATDGNHGRSVAWAAQRIGCRAVIFIHETVSEARAAAIAAYGAEVVRLPGGYDESVRHAFAEARARGWIVVQDTGGADYRDIPADITYGYGVLAREAIAQMEAPPSHVLVQAGVGGLASAVCAVFWMAWGARRPQLIVLEPTKADCVFQSLAAGRPTEVTGDLETVMAGLSCGVVSDLAWDVLKHGADGAIAIDDTHALAGMRRLAQPETGDPAIVAGECSGGAVGALLAIKDRPDLRGKLGIDARSRVLLIGTEGDTDPAIYRRTVGQSADEVRARGTA
jgi:diaminopropionate ammonia-lyase